MVLLQVFAKQLVLALCARRRARVISAHKLW